MASRAWTFILVPPDPRGRTRRFSVTSRMYRSAAIVVLASFATFGLWEWDRTNDARLASIEAAMAQRAVVAIGDSLRAVRDSNATAAERAAALRRVFMPVNGRISSAFSGARWHPILHILRVHRGVDVAASAGTPIIAPSTGRVRSVGWRVGYGLAIEIDHGNSVRSFYAHCRHAYVQVGQVVMPGQRIATVGSTGLSTGPHLHFEVFVRGKSVDPLRYLNKARQSSASFGEIAEAGQREAQLH